MDNKYPFQESSASLLGNVIECTNIEVKKLINISSSIGFPIISTPQPRISMKGSLEINNANLGRQMKYQSKSITEISNTFTNKDYELYNLNRITSMSKDEYLAAMDEITSLISSKNLSFLKNHTLEEKTVEVKSVNIDDKKIPIELKIINESNDINEMKLNITNQNHMKNESSSDDQLDIPADLNPAKYAIASNLVELLEKQKTAPEKLRAQFQWTLDDNTDSTEVNSKKDSSMNKNNKDSIFSLDNDRYDLRGRKVIHTDSYHIIVKTSILPHLKEINWGASTKENKSPLNDLAMKIIELCVECDLLSLPPPENETQPQDELRHHETDRDKSGYTLNEVCEMCRSEVHSQRALAWRILHGVLLRRDAVSSLEAYGLDTHLTTSSCSSSSTAATATASSTIFDPINPMNSNNNNNNNSSLWSRFQSMFTDIYNLILSSHFTSSIINNSSSSVGGGGVATPPTHPVLTSSDHRRLKRVIVFILLKFCATDLPLELPVMLLTSPDLTTNRPSNKIKYYQSIASFVLSAVEERVASNCHLGSGVWGIYGYPSLSLPLARRGELEYEAKIAECRSKLNERGDSTEATTAAAAAKSSLEDFLYCCQWSRVDTMLLNSVHGSGGTGSSSRGGRGGGTGSEEGAGGTLLVSLKTSVRDMLLTAFDLFGEYTYTTTTTTATAAISSSGNVDSRPSSIEHLSLLRCGAIALQLLCDASRAGSDACALQIEEFLVKSLWKHLLTFLKISFEFRSLSPHRVKTNQSNNNSSNSNNSNSNKEDAGIPSISNYDLATPPSSQVAMDKLTVILVSRIQATIWKLFSGLSKRNNALISWMFANDIDDILLVALVKGLTFPATATSSSTGDVTASSAASQTSEVPVAVATVGADDSDGDVVVCALRFLQVSLAQGSGLAVIADLWTLLQQHAHPLTPPPATASSTSLGRCLGPLAESSTAPRLAGLYDSLRQTAILVASQYTRLSAELTNSITQPLHSNINDMKISLLHITDTTRFLLSTAALLAPGLTTTTTQGVNSLEEESVLVAAMNFMISIFGTCQFTSFGKLADKVGQLALVSNSSLCQSCKRYCELVTDVAKRLSGQPPPPAAAAEGEAEGGDSSSGAEGVLEVLSVTSLLQGATKECILSYVSARTAVMTAGTREGQIPSWLTERSHRSPFPENATTTPTTASLSRLVSEEHNLATVRLALSFLYLLHQLRQDSKGGSLHQFGISESSLVQYETSLLQASLQGITGESRVEIPLEADGLVAWQLSRVRATLLLTSLGCICYLSSSSSSSSSGNNIKSSSREEASTSHEETSVTADSCRSSSNTTDNDNDNDHHLLLSLVHKVLPHLGQGFASIVLEYLTILAENISETFCSSLVTGEPDKEAAAAAMTSRILHAVFPTMIGDSSSSNYNIREISSLVLNSTSSCCSSSIVLSAADSYPINAWVTSPFHPSLPVPFDWIYRYMSDFSGPQLWQWIRMISTTTTAAAATPKSHPHYSTPPSSITTSCATRLYYLLRLASPDYCRKWFHNESRVLATSSEADSPSPSQTQTQTLEERETLCDETTVQCYSKLLTACVEDMYEECHRCGGADLSLWFNTVAQAEAWSLSGSSGDGHGTKSNFNRNNYSSYYQPNTSGSVALTGKLLESALAPFISHDIHALSLCPLLSTVLPWQLRERIWRELGGQRLIHLLESPLLEHCFCTFISYCETSLPVAQAIFKALLTLRCPDIDNHLMITQWAVYSLASYLFLYKEQDFIRQKAKLRFIQDMISNNNIIIEWSDDSIKQRNWIFSMLGRLGKKFTGCCATLLRSTTACNTNNSWNSNMRIESNDSIIVIVREILSASNSPFLNSSSTGVPRSEENALDDEVEEFKKLLQHAVVQEHEPFVA